MTNVTEKAGQGGMAATDEAKAPTTVRVSNPSLQACHACGKILDELRPKQRKFVLDFLYTEYGDQATDAEG